MLKVALTGGIGSGKSEVSSLFGNWGAYVFDADSIAKNILDENDSAQKEIILDFFEETKECKYDWIGMILSQFLPFNIKRKNKWYCSEWIAYALRISGVVDWKVIKIYNQTDLSPGQLHSIIMKQKKTESD